ncbi:MAG: hypothetical protein ABJG78_14895 [Cyclobacteriaceae bacterium]
MKYQLHLKQFLPFLAFLLLFGSCKEEHISEEIDLVDEDMIAATKLADEYLNASKGRQGSEKAVTVLKFKDDKLYYATTADDVTSYTEVNEETITASAKPGGYVFWYCGGGLSDLDGIEFDESSQLKLVDAPEEINADKMWVIAIPEDFDEEDGMLKYDIVYNFKGNDGPPIRLDPKIKITEAD